MDVQFVLMFMFRSKAMTSKSHKSQRLTGMSVEMQRLSPQLNMVEYYIAEAVSYGYSADGLGVNCKGKEM